MSIRRAWPWRTALLLAAVGVSLLPGRCAAQRLPPPTPRPAPVAPMLRADLLADTRGGAQAVLGLVATTAYNARMDLTIGGGGMARPDGWRAVGRVEAVGRWVTDPFRRGRWALSAGGGVALRLEDGRAPRPVLLVALGLDGPVRGTWMPGLDIGLGGGLRVGAALRRVRPNRR